MRLVVSVAMFLIGLYLRHHSGCYITLFFRIKLHLIPQSCGNGMRDITLPGHRIGSVHETGGIFLENKQQTRK